MPGRRTGRPAAESGVVQIEDEQVAVERRARGHVDRAAVAARLVRGEPAVPGFAALEAAPGDVERAQHPEAAAMLVELRRGATVAEGEARDRRARARLDRHDPDVVVAAQDQVARAGTLDRDRVVDHQMSEAGEDRDRPRRTAREIETDGVAGARRSDRVAERAVGIGAAAVGLVNGRVHREVTSRKRAGAGRSSRQEEVQHETSAVHWTKT